MDPAQTPVLYCTDAQVQPGGSGLVGLYQENGPCRINNDSSSVSFNPFSWNNVSNMCVHGDPLTPLRSLRLKGWSGSTSTSPYRRASLRGIGT